MDTNSSPSSCSMPALWKSPSLVRPLPFRFNVPLPSDMSPLAPLSSVSVRERCIVSGAEEPPSNVKLPIHPPKPASTVESILAVVFHTTSSPAPGAAPPRPDQFPPTDQIPHAAPCHVAVGP